MESYISSTERSLVWLLGLFALSTSVKLWLVCHAIVSFFWAHAKCHEVTLSTNSL